MTAPSTTKGDALEFPTEIRRPFRVRRERLAPGEYDVTIPLTGKRGFVYVYGSGWFGVWLTSQRPNASLNALKPVFPRMIAQQVGGHDCTFRVPAYDLERVCDRLGACRRRRLTDAQRRRAADQLKPYRFHAAKRPV